MFKLKINAHVGLCTKCSAINEHFEVFGTLTGKLILYSKSTVYSLGHALFFP